jgi:aryl-alcohol dehydrogenase-like predicted oxidoreductase
VELTHPGRTGLKVSRIITAPIIGASKPEQLDASLAAVDV